MPFSERARAALRHSRDEAVRLGHDAVAPEHLLLGLLREGGPPVRLLRGLGVNAQRLRQAVQDALPAVTPTDLVHPDLALTAGAEDALALAEREAAAVEPEEVGAEWVLLGVLADADGVAARVLRETFGVTADGVRAAVLRLLGIEPPEPAAVREPETPYLRDRAASAAHRLSIVFDGEATEEEVTEVLVLLSELYRALGGDGLVILDSGVPAWDEEGTGDE